VNGRAEAAKVFRGMRRDGFDVSYTGRQHVRIEHPDMAGPVFTASTPSCPFWARARHMQAEVRRSMRAKMA